MITRIHADTKNAGCRTRRRQDIREEKNMNRKEGLKIIALGTLIICAFCSAGYAADDFIKDTVTKIEEGMVLDGNYEDAEKKLEALLNTYPGNARIHAMLGVAHYGLMDYKRAFTYLTEAGKSAQDKAVKDMARYGRKAIGENRNILLEIEDVNRQVASGKLDGVEAKETLAVKHFRALDNLLKRKFYYAAIVTAHVTWIKSNFPDFPAIYEISGDIYYSAMYYRKAEEEYKTATKKDPDNARVYHALADCLVAIGDFDHADEYYEKSIELYAADGEKKNSNIIARLKQVKGALPKKYKDIEELIKGKLYSEAEDLCKKRLSLNPLDYVAISQLGEIYWKWGKKRHAIKLFRRAVRVVPDYPITHLLLGRAYIFENKYKKAVKEFGVFKEKMALIPKMDDDTRGMYISALHYIAYMYFTQKDHEKAFVECKEIISLDPEDADAHYNLAVCYYMYYRNRSAAYGELKKVMELDPNTHLASRAEFYIDYIRRNPDPRFMGDFTFLYEKEYE